MTKEDRKIFLEKEVARTAEFLNKLEKLYLEYELLFNFKEIEMIETKDEYIVNIGDLRTFSFSRETIAAMFEPVHKELTEIIEEEKRREEKRRRND